MNATSIVNAIVGNINADITVQNLGAFIKSEAAEERVGYESPLAHIKRGLPRAAGDVLRALVRQSLHTLFIEGDRSQWDTLREEMPHVQVYLERIDQALAQVLVRAGGHPWATVDIKPLSLMVRSEIQGTAPSWVPLSLPNWLEAVDNDEVDFEPLVAAAEWEKLRASRVPDFTFLETAAEMEVHRQGEWVKVPHHITRIKDSFERSLEQPWNTELNELYQAGSWEAFKPHQWFKLNRLLYAATAWVAAAFGGNIERGVEALSRTEVHSDAAGHRHETGGDYTGSESEHTNEVILASMMEELADLEEAVEAAEKQVLYHVGQLPKCYGYDAMPAKVEMVEEGQFAGRSLKDEVHAQKEQRQADMESGIVRGSAKRNRKALDDALALLANMK